MFLGDVAIEEVEKLELKTEVEGNLKKQSKTRPGKDNSIATLHHTVMRASNLLLHQFLVYKDYRVVHEQRVYRHARSTGGCGQTPAAAFSHRSSRSESPRTTARFHPAAARQLNDFPVISGGYSNLNPKTD